MTDIVRGRQRTYKTQSCGAERRLVRRVQGQGAYAAYGRAASRPIEGTLYAPFNPLRRRAFVLVRACREALTPSHLTLLSPCVVSKRKEGVLLTARSAALQRLETALSEAGINETRFLESAVAALGQVRGSGSADAAHQFGAEDRATLAAGHFDLSPPDDVTQDHVAVTAARFAALLADSADVPEVAAKLGVTSARIRQRANERSLYAIREANEWRFPRWQFDAQGQPIRALATIIAALPSDLHPVATARFLSEPLLDLEIDDEPVSPLAWLQSGGAPDRAARIARDL